MSKRDDLKQRAAALNITFKGNISNTDLEDLIKDAEAAQIEAVQQSGATGTVQDPGASHPPTPPATHGTGDVQSRTSPEAEIEPGFIWRVTGPKKGRRRAGFHFGKEAVTLTEADLDNAQLMALIGDPKLTLQCFKNGEAMSEVFQGGTIPDVIQGFLNPQ